MAGIIEHHDDTGLTLFAYAKRATDAYVWNTNGVDINTWTPYVVANIDRYKITMTETPASSKIYLGDFPSGIAAGAYPVFIADANGDRARGQMEWDGSAEVPLNSRSSHTAAQAGTDAASKVLTTPANTLDTDASGRVTPDDKTGYGLASDGLDSISTTQPAGVASNFREMVIQTWRFFFKKSKLVKTGLETGTLTTYKDDGTTVATTQAVSDDGTTEEKGAST